MRTPTKEQAAPSYDGPDRTAEHMVVRAAERMRELEEENARLRSIAHEVGEHLGTRSEELRAFDASHRVDQILSSAWILERRGERCHVAFTRDVGGIISGVGLYVEAK